MAQKKPVHVATHRFQAAFGQFESTAQIGVLDIRVFQKILACVVQANLAGFQYVAPVSQIQRLVGILLDQEDGDAFLAKLADDLENLLDHQRCQAQGLSLIPL